MSGSLPATVTLQGISLAESQSLTMTTQDVPRNLKPPAHPGKISRAKLTAAIRSLGLEPEQIRSIRVTPWQVEIDTWLYDDSYDPPSRRINEATDNFFKHHMSVPVVDD